MPAQTLKRNLQVPLLDLKAQFRAIEVEVMEALREVCGAQRFILGPSVKELEERIAAYSQCRHGVGVSSGTDALLVALMALEVGPGDAVITSPFTFFATGGAIARLGARPLFCDIDPATYNLSPDAVKDFLSSHCQMQDGRLIDRRSGSTVKVIMPVHLYGQAADMESLTELARRHGMRIIEDAAQAIGSEYKDGQRAGSMGDIGCFSFFPSKNLGAFGDGGLCATGDAALAERMQLLRVHGAKPKYYHSIVGGNFRLDELQAAVLLIKLKYLDQWTAARQANACRYDELLAPLTEHVTRPQVAPGCRHIFNQYVIRVPRRDELKKYLADAGIGTEIYYPVPLHVQKCFAYLGAAADDCPQAMRAAHETLALPIFPELTAEQQQYVAEAIAAFYS
jgi:dTDP-4-amino-4,6-dideoxygalactose transaminase